MDGGSQPAETSFRRKARELDGVGYYALIRTLSGTPSLGAFQTLSLRLNYQFRVGQQPKPQIFGCVCFLVFGF